jgi:hypothetical protein
MPGDRQIASRRSRVGSTGMSSKVQMIGFSPESLESSTGPGYAPGRPWEDSAAVHPRHPRPGWAGSPPTNSTRNAAALPFTLANAPNDLDREEARLHNHCTEPP